MSSARLKWRSLYANVFRLYRFLFRRKRSTSFSLDCVPALMRFRSFGSAVHAIPFNDWHARRMRRNARLMAGKWAGRPEPARALYWRLHPAQVKPRYTLSDLLEEMPAQGAPRLPDWEAATPVGRELLPEQSPWRA